MCGRYSNTLDRQAMEQRFGVAIPFSDGSRRFNIAPTESVLAVVLSREGKPIAQALRWGLVPHFATDLRSSSKMINARSETVTKRPAFRSLIATAERRALLPADGFYEWLRAEHRASRPVPFRFTVDGGAPFAFAGLWSRAVIDGEHVASATILTTAANPLVARVHERMPVILADRASEQAWLDPTITTDEAISLCVPLNATRMKADPVNPALNKAGIDEGPELLEAPDVG